MDILLSGVTRNMGRQTEETACSSKSEARDNKMAGYLFEFGFYLQFLIS